MKEKVVWSIEGNINDVGNRIVACVKNTVKEIVGKSRSSMPESK